MAVFLAVSFLPHAPLLQQPPTSHAGAKSEISGQMSVRRRGDDRQKRRQKRELDIESLGVSFRRVLRIYSVRQACWMMRCTSPPLGLLRSTAVLPALSRSPGALRTMAGSVTRQGRRAYDGLPVDAGGTLLQLARPVEETYAAIGKKYGLAATEVEIKQGFRRAFSAPWPKSLRYQDDGREFWRLVVSEATGCSRNDYFEEVYQVVNATAVPWRCQKPILDNSW